MTLDEQNRLIEIYTQRGWKIDRNNEEWLSFSFYEHEEHEWFHDYNKKSGSCIRMNGRQKMKLVQSK